MIRTFVLLVLSVAVLFSCTSKDAENQKTSQDYFKTAIQSETTMSLKYAGFSKHAMDNGETAIALLFNTVSMSESVHAKSHMKVLADLLLKIDEFEPEFEVKSTVENLQAAIGGEANDYELIYPRLIAAARADHIDNAVCSYTWAVEVEKQHFLLFTKALEAYNTQSTHLLPKSYSICSNCGYIYSDSMLPDVCVLCKHKR